MSNVIGWKDAAAALGTVLLLLFGALGPLALTWVSALADEVEENTATLRERSGAIEGAATVGRDNAKRIKKVEETVIRIETETRHNKETLERIEDKLNKALD